MFKSSMVLTRVISGGQTSIDQLGLEVARSLGIPTGGVATKGFLTEYGPNSLLRDDYGLTEHTSASYPPRTRSNVQQSDGTVLFGELTGGTKLTADACRTAGKPCIVNPTADQLRAWLIEHQVKVLNVAGNRASSLPVEQMREYRCILYDVFTTNRKLVVLFSQRPPQWGLRGDPFLWAELAKIGETLQLPSTEAELAPLLRLLIENLIGDQLIPGKTIHVPRYIYGGMSNGMVDADFWLENAIPFLKRQFTESSR